MITQNDAVVPTCRGFSLDKVFWGSVQPCEPAFHLKIDTVVTGLHCQHYQTYHVSTILTTLIFFLNREHILP